jgi:hypothetical protein
VVRRDHRVKLAAHGANENRVSRERALNARFSCCRREQNVVLSAEPAPIACMRVQSAQRDTRRGDIEPFDEARASDFCGIENGLTRQGFGHVAQREVGGCEYDAELVRRKHHRHSRSRQLGQHLGVARIIVATCM